MMHYDRVWAEVDLDAVSCNIQSIQQKIQKTTKIIAVVKTDGYGHGAVRMGVCSCNCGGSACTA